MLFGGDFFVVAPPASGVEVSATQDPFRRFPAAEISPWLARLLSVSRPIDVKVWFFVGGHYFRQVDKPQKILA